VRRLRLTSTRSEKARTESYIIRLTGIFFYLYAFCIQGPADNTNCGERDWTTVSVSLIEGVERWIVPSRPASGTGNNNGMVRCRRRNGWWNLTWVAMDNTTDVPTGWEGERITPGPRGGIGRGSDRELASLRSLSTRR
jgi:hypothetical protein